MDNCYKCFLLCLTYDSMLNYLDNIENEECIMNSCGTLLIDQLLVAGNGKNRFLSCNYDYGTIKLSSAKNVFPDNQYKALTVHYLQQHVDLLRNSILTERQRESILNGVLI